jgi:hypothetical protein
MHHAHAHPPEALIEGPEHTLPAALGFERRLELFAVLLLAIATLATAWCGYQAATWSGHQSQAFADHSNTRIRAAEAHMEAGQLRIDDLLYFNHWLDASRSGDKELADVYRRRFRPEFVPAFEAWMAQRPFSTDRAVIPGPLYMPQYRLSGLAESKELNAAADEHYREGTGARITADRYILATVFMAAVLFFAGISLRLNWRPLQVAVLAMACAMLVGGGAFILTLPIA